MAVGSCVLLAAEGPMAQTHVQAQTHAQAQAQAPVPAWSLEAQSRLRPGGLDAATFAERQGLLLQGEQALSRMQPSQALDLFDRAALMLHAADAEVALVRTHMQAGDYRRALAFGAHAAGAHRDQPAALALYAWLLHLGGQGTAARWQLDQALHGHTASPELWAQTRRLLEQPWPAKATGGMHLAPYGVAVAGSVQVRVAGSATLLPGGRVALAPLALLGSAETVWLRNGLGQLSAAHVVQGWPQLGLVALALAEPLPFPADLDLAGTTPFAGSPGTMIEFGSTEVDAPAWPVLRQGFFARDGAGPRRPLGLDAPPGPRGGPVFDRAGRWVGLALADASGPALMVALVDLPDGLVDVPTAAPAVRGAMPEAEVYERALRMALQLIVPR